MLDAVTALIVSIIAVLVLLRLKIHVGIAVFAGAFVLAFLTLSYNEILTLFYDTITNIQTWRLVIIIVSAMGLSAAMDKKGLLRRLAQSLERIGSRPALYMIPAVIGLVPMPAGALVSASMVRDVSKKWNLGPEEITFLNYWFRHIIEYSWPIYQGIILASAIFSTTVSQIVRTLFIMTIVNAVIGLTIGYFVFKNKVAPKVEGESSSAKLILYEFIKASWPILLIIILIVVLNVDTALAFAISLTTLLMTSQFKKRDLVRIFKEALNVKIILLLIAIMFYKIIIEYTDTALSFYMLLTKFGVPEFLIVASLPFTIGFITGVSFAFVGVTFPLLVPIVGLGNINGGALILAYVSGMAGVLLTPLHLCLVLSVDFFKANILKTYRFILPAVLMSEVVALAMYFYYSVLLRP